LCRVGRLGRPVSETLSSADRARADAAAALIRVEGGEIRLGPLTQALAEELAGALRALDLAGVSLLDLVQLQPALARAAIRAQAGLLGRKGQAEISIHCDGERLTPVYAPPRETFRPAE
jgi:hypothetical protein